MEQLQHEQCSSPLSRAPCWFRTSAPAVRPFRPSTADTFSPRPGSTTVSCSPGTPPRRGRPRRRRCGWSGAGTAPSCPAACPPCPGPCGSPRPCCTTPALPVPSPPAAAPGAPGTARRSPSATKRYPADAPGSAVYLKMYAQSQKRVPADEQTAATPEHWSGLTCSANNAYRPRRFETGDIVFICWLVDGDRKLVGARGVVERGWDPSRDSAPPQLRRLHPDIRSSFWSPDGRALRPPPPTRP